MFVKFDICICFRIKITTRKRQDRRRRENGSTEGNTRRWKTSRRILRIECNQQYVSFSQTQLEIPDNVIQLINEMQAQTNFHYVLLFFSVLFCFCFLVFVFVFWFYFTCDFTCNLGKFSFERSNVQTFLSVCISFNILS